MLNIQTQHKFKYAHQQILFFKLLFNVKLIYSTRALALGAIGHFFLQWWGRGRGANDPPVHGIKKCLDTIITYNIPATVTFH